MKRISFVIPVFRNERAVTMTYQQIRQVLASDLSTYGYEVIFIDDGSDDGSLEELLTIRNADPNVQVVSFTRNFGQMAAILAGFKQATGDLIVQLSADLQDPIGLVPQMVAAYERGSEVVACHREHREDGLSRRLTSRVLYGILRLSLPQIPSGGFDYILLDRKVVDAFNSVDVRNRFFQGDILWFGYRTTFIPYTRLKREIGKSQYTFGKRLKNSLDAILDSSYLPIRFISLVGVITAFVGFLYAVDIVYEKLRHNIPLTGWAPIMILILVIGGVLMLMLGIIGEYVWRIYDEVKGKPNYIVRQIY